MMYVIVSMNGILAEQSKAHLEALADYVPRNALRRMGHYERLGLLCAFMCLEKATGDCKSLACAPERMGIIIATCYGPVDSTFSFLDSALESGHSLTSPTAFSTSVYNILSTTISMQTGITGPALSLSQGAHSLSAAILQADLWLKSRRADYVLLGAVDQYSAQLNSLISELNDSAIIPSQDLALFMLLTNDADTTGRYIICDAGHGLRVEDNIAETLAGKQLSNPHPAPCGPLYSLLQAFNNMVLEKQRCCLAIPGQGFSYVDVKRNHESHKF